MKHDNEIAVKVLKEKYGKDYSVGSFYKHDNEYELIVSALEIQKDFFIHKARGKMTPVCTLITVIEKDIPELLTESLNKAKISVNSISEREVYKNLIQS